MTTDVPRRGRPERSSRVANLIQLEEKGAEWRARNRLLRLQTAVVKTMRAAKRLGQNASSGA